MRVTRHPVCALGFAIGAVVSAAPAWGQEGAADAKGEKEFGDQGVVHIGASSLLNFSYVTDSPPGGGSSSNVTLVEIAPDVDYFVIDGLSIGGKLLFGYLKPNQGDGITLYGIGPTVGYNVWLVPGKLSLWPQATFAFEHIGTSATTTTAGTGQPTTSTTITVAQNRTNLTVWVPLEVHPVRHFDFGIGPYFSVDLSNSASTNNVSTDLPKATSFGLEGEIGGWL